MIGASEVASLKTLVGRNPERYALGFVRRDGVTSKAVDAGKMSMVGKSGRRNVRSGGRAQLAEQMKCGNEGHFLRVITDWYCGRRRSTMSKQ